MPNGKLERHSFKANLLLFLAMLDDFAGEVSYNNVYRQLKWPGYKRKSTVEMVRRMIKDDDLKDDGKHLRISEEGLAKINGFLPVKRFAAKSWDGKWRLIIFDIPEKDRLKRDQLRIMLNRYGYGQWQKSVYLTPHPVFGEVDKWLKTTGIYPQAVCFESKAVGGMDNRGLAEAAFNQSQKIDAWQKIIGDGAKLIKNENDEGEKIWIKTWEEMLIADPWLPKELERPELGHLKRSARDIMHQIIKL